MGNVAGPLRPLRAFHGAGPVRRALGMRLVITTNAKLKPGEVGAEAVVHAGTEGLHCWGTVAGDVEAVGIVVDGGIAVGGPGVGDD